MSGGYRVPVQVHAPVDQGSDPRVQAGDEAPTSLGQCLGSRSQGAGVRRDPAHYDHLGIRDGAMFPGRRRQRVRRRRHAGDRRVPASGRRSSRTVVFAAFDAEERGLQGSQAFMIAPPMPKERMALNVNLDMVSRNDQARDLYRRHLSVSAVSSRCSTRSRSARRSRCCSGTTNR